MIRTEQFLDGSHSANVVRELQRSMNANACQKLKPTLEKRVTDMYKGSNKEAYMCMCAIGRQDPDGKPGSCCVYARM